MGANAQTSVPTFTAGDVLTAANMNISAGTGVPVFATTTTRDAAFGGTGEKTLAEGQMCYVENLTGVAQLQYYDGAAWVSFPTAGLVYLTGAAFTTATSFSLPNNTFSSTYRNYRLVMQITAVTSDADFSIRMRAGGSDDTNSSYQYYFGGIDSAGTARNSSGATTSWVAGESDATGVGYGLVLDILGPQTTNRTLIHGFYQFVDKGATYIAGRFGGGSFTANTSFDSLSFISSVASSITGTYRVYGYADS